MISVALLHVFYPSLRSWEEDKEDMRKNIEKASLPFAHRSCSLINSQQASFLEDEESQKGEASSPNDDLQMQVEKDLR